MKTVIVSLVILTLVSFFIAIRHFMNKGFLFNNAFLYATKKERDAMDKHPYYVQSGIVFTAIGFIWLFLLAEVLFELRFMMYLVYALEAAILVYAVVSTITINKKYK